MWGKKVNVSDLSLVLTKWYRSKTSLGQYLKHLMVYFIVTACHFLLQYKDNLIFPFDVLQLEKLMVKYNLFLQELTGSCFISNEQSQARRVGNTFFRKTDNPLSDCFEILLVRHLVQQLLIPVIHFIH